MLAVESQRVRLVARTFRPGAAESSSSRSGADSRTCSKLSSTSRVCLLRRWPLRRSSGDWLALSVTRASVRWWGPPARDRRWRRALRRTPRPRTHLLARRQPAARRGSSPGPRPGKGQEPHLGTAEPLAYLLCLPLASNKWRGLGGRVVRVALEGPQGGNCDCRSGAVSWKILSDLERSLRRLSPGLSTTSPSVGDLIPAPGYSRRAAPARRDRPRAASPPG